MTIQRWAALGCFLLAAAVILGAFGAHGLKDRLDPYSLEVYQKAAFYHFTHALGLLLLASLSSQNLLNEAAYQKIALLLCVGIILFSGSLYLLAITGIKWLGAITPLGGTAFIISWIWAGVSLLKS